MLLLILMSVLVGSDFMNLSKTASSVIFHLLCEIGTRF